MLVVNAANIAADWAHIVALKRGANVRLRDISDATALLAVQAREPRRCSRRSAVGVAMIPYYHFAEGKVAGESSASSREPGTREKMGSSCTAARPTRNPCGTRWSERGGPSRAGWAPATRCGSSGYPLYGNDIDASVTPYEAGLGWIVKLEKGAEFTGLAALKRQKLAGVKRRLVGFKVCEPKVVARHGYGVYLDGPQVDVVRSGTVTPTVKLRDRNDLLAGGRDQAGHAVHDRRARQAGAGGGGDAAVRAEEN